MCEAIYSLPLLLVIPAFLCIMFSYLTSVSELFISLVCSVCSCANTSLVLI